MHELVQLLSNNTLIVFGSITLICVVPSIAHYWWKVRKAEAEAVVKREMIQRGYTAEEIRLVLDSRPKDEAKLPGGS